VCPAGIDHPKLFLSYRQKDVVGDRKFRGKRRPWLERLFYKVWSWAGNRSWRWNLCVRLIRPMINRHAKDGKLKKMMGPADGWFRSRDLPAVSDVTFHDRWKTLKVQDQITDTGNR
jgi:hypothetical protein